MRAHRPDRLGHRPDQLVIKCAGIVVSTQAGRFRGLHVAAHRFAVHAAMRGDPAVPRCR
jgi:hypothetical protein